jgi:hypothetical protein
MSVSERRWLILLAVLLVGLASCRAVDPDLELTAQEEPLQSPLATESTLGSPLDSPATGTSPLQTPVAVLQSPVEPGVTVKPTQAAQPTIPAVQPGSASLIILHTNDTWGYYDPCG